MKIRPFLCCIAAFALAGCAGYQVGSAQPMYMKGIHTLAVPTFKNNTLEPRIEVLAADAVIKQIQQDGTYTVTSEDHADAVIEGAVMRIIRRSARSVRGNVLATREFDLRVELRFTIKKPGASEAVDTRTVTGTTNFFVSSDVQQDERQALPLAIEDAAVRLVSEISEGW